jgi:Helix-turn-helix
LGDLFAAEGRKKCHRHLCTISYGIRQGIDALPFCKVTLRKDALPPWPVLHPGKRLSGQSEDHRRGDSEETTRPQPSALRQIDVAKIIGCHELTVVNWEKGYRTPRINHVAGIIRFLGYDPPGGRRHRADPA